MPFLFLKFTYPHLSQEMAYLLLYWEETLEILHKFLLYIQVILNTFCYCYFCLTQRGHVSWPSKGTSHYLDPNTSLFLPEFCSIHYPLLFCWQLSSNSYLCYIQICLGIFLYINKRNKPCHLYPFIYHKHVPESIRCCHVHSLAIPYLFHSDLSV